MTPQNQLSLSLDGAARGAIGMALATDRTERAKAGWTAAAIERVRAYAATATGDFTIEQARATFTGFEEPCDLRAWGQVTRSCVSRGYIVAVGYRPAASSNGSPKPVYRRAV